MSEKVPDDLADLLRTGILAHVSLLKSDGSIVTHVMWVDYDGEHVLTSSPAASWKSRALRARPQVSISVVDPQDAWRRLSISGRVTRVHADEGLEFINRMSQRYVGGPYPRQDAREVFEITPARVRAFRGRGR